MSFKVIALGLMTLFMLGCSSEVDKCVELSIKENNEFIENLKNHKSSNDFVDKELYFFNNFVKKDMKEILKEECKRVSVLKKYKTYTCSTTNDLEKCDKNCKRMGTEYFAFERRQISISKTRININEDNITTVSLPRVSEFIKNSEDFIGCVSEDPKNWDCSRRKFLDFSGREIEIRKMQNDVYFEYKYPIQDPFELEIYGRCAKL